MRELTQVVCELNVLKKASAVCVVLGFGSQRHIKPTYSQKMIERNIPPGRDAQVFKCVEPFSFQELLAEMKLVSAAGGAEDPFFFDLRKVDLLKFKQKDFTTHIRKFQTEVEARQRNKCVYLVAGDAEFGMARMYSILSSLDNLRDEELVFVTYDEASAIAWFSANLRSSTGGDIAECLNG